MKGLLADFDERIKEYDNEADKERKKSNLVQIDVNDIDSIIRVRENTRRDSQLMMAFAPFKDLDLPIDEQEENQIQDDFADFDFDASPSP